MNKNQYKIICDFRDEYKKKIDEWQKKCPSLKELQKEAALFFKTPEYSFETPVVYNKDLDLITEGTDLKLIVIGDNPGKDEQLAKNCRYLVGQAGKIAEGFFRKNIDLNIDFRKNVIILNKTPVHSAKTNQLKKIMSLGGKEVSDLILESQLWMAEKTADLQIQFNKAAGSEEQKMEIWLVGYSELKDKGFFVSYRDRLLQKYAESDNKLIDDWNKVYVFQHFSMNRFTIDLKDFTTENHLEKEKLIVQSHKT